MSVPLPDEEMPKQGQSFAECMLDFENQILSNYEMEAKVDLRPSSASVSVESTVGDGMQLNGAPMFTRHSSPMDTELEINLMDELAGFFALPDPFRFANGGLGIINYNENDSLICLIYSAKFAKESDLDEQVASDRYVIYTPSQREDKHWLERVCQVTDSLNHQYSSINNLIEIVNNDLENDLIPLFVIDDLLFSD